MRLRCGWYKTWAAGQVWETWWTVRVQRQCWGRYKLAIGQKMSRTGQVCLQKRHQETLEKTRTVCDKKKSPGFWQGRKCDECMPKTWGFNSSAELGCVQCDCDSQGTLPNALETCDPYTGQCECRNKTFKRRCDECKPGTFYLDGKNSEGCTGLSISHHSLKFWENALEYR